MSVATYPALVRNGKIEPLAPLALPEGSTVYLIVQPGIDKRTARRRATGWLMDHIGNVGSISLRNLRQFDASA